MTLAATQRPGAPEGNRHERTDRVVAELASLCEARPGPGHLPDPAREAALREQLITLNLPVAASVAGRYARRGIPEEDLRQVAYLALTQAARRFDATLGHSFLSFCVPTIRGEVRRHFRDQGWTIRPPRRLQELQADALRTRSELAMVLGREPSVSEVATALDEEPADVVEALELHVCFTPDSLDRPLGDHDGGVLADLLGGADHEQGLVEARLVLAPLIQELGERDRRILRMRFFDGLTQREIAEEIGVTQMQVSRLLSRIYRDLRRGLGVPDPEPRRRMARV